MSYTQLPSTVGWIVTSLIMWLYGIKFHINLIMLKNAEKDYWLLSLLTWLVIVISASIQLLFVQGEDSERIKLERD